MDLKTLYTKIFLKSSGQITNIDNIQSFRIKWWYNQRSKNSGGLRLTDEGIEFIKAKTGIKIYSIDVPEEIKKIPQLLIWLDKFISTPYYLEKNTITVTDEKLAFELHLFSGNIRKMGLTKAIRIRDPEIYK